MRLIQIVHEGGLETIRQRLPLVHQYWLSDGYSAQRIDV